MQNGIAGNISTSTATPAREFYGHRLNLSEDLDGIFNEFSRSTKRNVRKAVKCGVHVYTEKSLKSLDRFYALHCKARKKLELPPQPYRFFRNIYRYIILNKMGDVLFGSYNGKTIACVIFFHFGGRAYGEFGVLDMKYQKVEAYNLLLWEAIKRYAEKGYKEIYFGRKDLVNEGLRSFKLRWGTIEYPIKYFRYDMINERMVMLDTSRFYKMIKLCFGNMPISASKIISRLLYRSFG
jgi:lipid II:glycine glycyltransferase (peptidoglycan interpeptide bridge formation enzyme)